MEKNKAEQMVELAKQYYSQGQILMAKTCFEQATQVDPQHSDAFNGLATTICDLNNGEWNEEAVEAILTALKLDPQNFKAWNNIGDYHYRRGEFDQAIEYFSKALEFQPNYAIAYVNLALSYRNTMRAKEALDCLRKAITIDPKNGWARYQLGLTYLYRGMRFECLVDLEKAREIFISVDSLGLDSEELPVKKMVAMIDAYLRIFVNMKDLQRMLVEQTQYFGDLRDEEVFGCLVN